MHSKKHGRDSRLLVDSTGPNSAILCQNLTIAAATGGERNSEIKNYVWNGGS